MRYAEMRVGLICYLWRSSRQILCHRATISRESGRIGYIMAIAYNRQKVCMDVSWTSC